MKKKHLLINFFVVVALASCTQTQNTYKSPPGYNLSKPTKFNMPDELFEISGIAFNKGNPDTIFAIQDEAGKIFHWKLGSKEITHAKFAKAGDYEDITIHNSQAIVLRSDGTLFSFSLAAINSKDIEQVVEWKDLVPPGEYEAIYADPITNNIYVLCKGCAADKKSATVSGYILQLSGDQLQQTGAFTMSTTGIKMASGKKDQKFRPSAITRNPRTQEWYILSSINKMLVIATPDWTIKESYPLSPSHFVQPEGIAFDRQYNLYISNEGDKLDEGNVLKFEFKMP